MWADNAWWLTFISPLFQYYFAMQNINQLIVLEFSSSLDFTGSFFLFILQVEYSEGLKTVRAYFSASKSSSPSNAFLQLSTSTPSVKVIID